MSGIFRHMAKGEFPMKRSRFSENQVIKILKETEAGVPVTNLRRTHGFSKSSFYKWKAKHGGMVAFDLLRLREQEVENRRMKQMYAELSL
jgi:putative transposase